MEVEEGADLAAEGTRLYWYSVNCRWLDRKLGKAEEFEAANLSQGSFPRGVSENFGRNGDGWRGGGKGSCRGQVQAQRPCLGAPLAESLFCVGGDLLIFVQWNVGISLLLPVPRECQTLSGVCAPDATISTW